MQTIGTKTNGITITGFITSGNPNIIGSFTLKIPGNKPPFPIVRIRFDLQQKIISTASGIVSPVPPKKIIILAKSLVTIYGLNANASA